MSIQRQQGFLILTTILIILSAVPSARGRTILGVSADKAEVTVGCLYPMTGRGGLYGRDSVAAIEVALDELRKRGDYPKIHVIVEDSKSKSSRAVQIVRTFIEEDKVDFLCGVVSSGVALAVTEIARRAKIIFIGTDHASTRLTDQALHPYYFRVNNNTRQSMKAGARYLQDLQQDTHWQKIAFIGPDYEYGHRAWLDLREIMDQLKVSYKVVGEFWPKLYEPDFSAYISALLEGDAEVLVNAHWGGDLVEFIRQADDFGLFKKMRFLNFDSGGNYEVMSALGEKMPLGLVLSARHHNNWPDTPENRSFVSRFHAQSGRYPSYAAEGAYAGILVIAEAVRKVAPIHEVNLTTQQRKTRLIHTFEQLRLRLPEDPEGFTSYINPRTHQMIQAQAVGETVPNRNFPPASVMLGRWKIYLPDSYRKR